MEVEMIENERKYNKNAFLLIIIFIIFCSTTLAILLGPNILVYSTLGAAMTLFPFGIAALVWVHKSPQSFLKVLYWVGVVGIVLTPFIVMFLDIEEELAPILAGILEVLCINAVITAKLFLWSSENSKIDS